MRSVSDGVGKDFRKKEALRGWLGLVAGLAVVWVMAYVVLPWGQNLPHVRPIMQAIADSNVDTGTYWYSQCENTAVAQMYVQNAIRNK